MSSLLTAVKMAYRKHCMDDESIGWGELGNVLLDALCNELGTDGYWEWLQQARKEMEGEDRPLCDVCRGLLVTTEKHFHDYGYAIVTVPCICPEARKEMEGSDESGR